LNSAYLTKLKEFTREDTTFADLNGLIASHMLAWDVFGGKGIFREGSAGTVSLLPQDVRPSRWKDGYANYSPFNVHAKLGQELLRHATISVTLDTYSHVLLNMTYQTATIIEDVLS
jgi:hypothetical protein